MGCGPGTTIHIWRRFAQTVIGLDIAEEALRYARSRGTDQVFRDDAQTLSTIASESTDMVVSCDVLEHLHNDHAAIAAAYRVLRKGGLLFITVPAKMYLWGGADIMSQHYRRYEKEDIAAMLIKNNFHILRITYFNTFLFIPILAARKVAVLFSIRPEREYTLPSRWLNAILYTVFRAEKYFLPYLNFPIGVSLAVVAQKQKERTSRDVCSLNAAGYRTDRVCP
mgnify:FL=1